MRTERFKAEEKPKKKHRLLKATAVIIPLLLAAIAGLVYYSYKEAEDSLAISFTEDAPKLEVE